MSMHARRSVALAAVLALASAGLAAGSAHAEARKKTDGCLVSYDAAAGKLVVKDRHNHKDVEFRVKQATSVLDRAGTVATKDGRKAQLSELETNRPVVAYWVTDPENSSGKFANKVDQPNAIDKATGKPDPDIMEDAGCKTDE
jgi:hypothetical protein